MVDPWLTINLIAAGIVTGSLLYIIIAGTAGLEASLGKRSKRTLRKEMRRLNQSVQHLASEIVLAEMALYNMNQRLSKLASKSLGRQNASQVSGPATDAASTPDNANAKGTRWETTWTSPSRS